MALLVRPLREARDAVDKPGALPAPPESPQEMRDDTRLRDSIGRDLHQFRGPIHVHRHELRDEVENGGGLFSIDAAS